MTRIDQYLNNLSKHQILNTAHESDEVIEVEIIVPVYNGFDALVKCLDALLRYTDQYQFITLLNDASTDHRVNEYLSTLAVHDQVTVINRKQNLGYLQNVNQYLTTVDHHVLLLNADTQVTDGWLAAMLCVARDEKVGAVCPLSNNATILTLPTQDPTQIEHLTALKGMWYPIPTAVGFCLLIKQAVLQQLGGFDPFYDPGYGEECDYSMLIRQAGWQVACAPAAYVKHQGSQSFRATATDLQTQHQKLLDLRWPLYSGEVEAFHTKNPTHLIQHWLAAKNTRQSKVLHVVHGIDNKGGVELFTHELIAQFSNELQHTIIMPPRNKKFLNESPVDEQLKIIEIPVGLNQPEHIIFNLPADLYQTSMDQFFHQLLLLGNFQMVHFHSLVGVGSQIWPLICQQLDIPYFFFVHDHSGLCQIFSLSTTNNKQEVFCGNNQSDETSEQCLKCLSKKTQKTRLTTQSFLQIRKKIWHKTLTGAEKIQFASHYLRNAYLKIFPEISEHSQVFSPCYYPSQVARLKPLNPGKLRLAFLGQFGVLKGAQLFIDLYHRLNNPAIGWQIIGGVDPKYKDQLDHTNITITGSYDKDNLGKLLKDVDLVVFTAQIPETYSITLTEAWIHGVPVVAPDLGAYGQRITEGVNGFLYQNNNLASLVNAIENFIKKQQQNDAIRSIEFVQDNENLTAVLERQYHQSITTKQSRTWVKPGGLELSLLPPPRSNAYQSMQMWIEAPQTLEAGADWLTPPSGCPVLLLGTIDELFLKSQNNIKTHLQSPKFIDAKDLAHTDADTVLIIEAGAHINENIGNWMSSFTATNAKLGLADFALHNQTQQIYAPQFQAGFSWTNFDAGHQIVGCLLLKKSAWKADLLQQTLQQPQPLRQLVRKAHQTNQVSYFPHFSHTILDQLWVKKWKSAPQKKQVKSKPYKLLILLASQLPKSQIKGVVKLISQQNTVINGLTDVIHLDVENQQDETPTIDEKAYTHFMLLHDNVRMSNDDCIEKLITSLQDSELDAISMPAATEGNRNHLLAKKYGSDLHFHGIGRIRDIRFDWPGSATEHELLDDDMMLFSQAAWQTVRSEILTPNGFYQALRCSQALQQAGFKIGISNDPGWHKHGIPYLQFTQSKTTLASERMDIIDASLHQPTHSNYSPALSCTYPCNLDLVHVVFKTPKTLPRVVAYAQDDWASGFYRVKSPLNVLAAENKISVQFMSTKHRHWVPSPHELARLQPDALLLHGFYADKQLKALHQYHKQLNIHTIISLDDLLTQIPDYSPMTNKVPDDVGTRIKLACSLADTLLVSSDVLATQCKNWHRNIKVIPNRLSKTLWPQVQNAIPTEKKLRIGWAGAGQHQADLLWIKPLVEQTHHQFDWVFFGDHPEGIDLNMIEFHSPVNLLHYPAKLQQLGLNLAIAPLVDNAFNAAKSALKLLEYGALGIPVLASDLPCYQNSPADLLPNQPKLWKDQLEAYDNDRQLLYDNGQTMRAWVSDHHWLEDHTAQWLELLQIDE